MNSFKSLVYDRFIPEYEYWWDWARNHYRGNPYYWRVNLISYIVFIVIDVVGCIITKTNPFRFFYQFKKNKWVLFCSLSYALYYSIIIWYRLFVFFSFDCNDPSSLNAIIQDLTKHFWFSLLFWQSVYWKINGILSME